MGKRLGFLAVVLMPALLLGGCATTGNSNKDLEVQALKNRILALQAENEAKDQQLSKLNDAMQSLSESLDQAQVGVKTKSEPTVKQIQAALKNAGYNPGLIDGKMGKASVDAVKDFQKANNLKADGKVGKRTWELLSKYLTEKVK